MLQDNSLKIGVIGGSGAYFLLKEMGKEIRKIIIKTPFGEASPIRICNMEDISFSFLSRHGEKGYEISAPFVNYRANIWAFKEIGIERVISWSGPGIINTDFGIGDYLLPNDIIDETKSRHYTFFESSGLGFIRQMPLFCPHLREVAANIIERLGYKLHKEGVYVCTEGPRLETVAEIKKMELMGGDIVGMTLVPECFLAKELEMCYLPICYLTNYAEGVRRRSFKKGVLFEGMVDEEEKERIDRSNRNLIEIIKEIIKKSESHKRDCPCKDSMNRYKSQGIVGEDWREWIKTRKKKS